MNSAEPSTLPTSSSSPADSPWQRVADSAVMLYALLFLVTGVLGVPLIFKSRTLSPRHKWLLAVGVTLYTAVLVAIVGVIVVWAWRTIQAAL